MEAIDSNDRVNVTRKRQVVAATAVWVSVIATVLLYLLFGWLNVWRPHTFWWLLTTTVVACSAVASFLLMLIQLRGRDAIRAVGVFFFSVLPLIWIAASIWSTVNTIEARVDYRLNRPIKALGLWVGSYFELEARWRYSRITEGKHVTLFDDGTNPNVVQMVADMDQHIEQMSEILETPLSDTKVRWVRGNLFGQSGRAIGAWAICGMNDNPDEVDSLDRHEIAHVVITLICPVDQEMPMLFAEGWAETQSREKPEKLLELMEQKKLPEALTLDQIVQENYGGSAGPAYNYGGPFAWYLLERFGGAKYVELYGGIRRDSFRDDVLRITGVTWKQLEIDFWQWLEEQREWAIATKRENGEATIFSLDRDSDRERWQGILSAAKSAADPIRDIKNVAFRVSEESDDWLRNSSIVIEDDALWKKVEQELPAPASKNYQIATPVISGYFHRKDGKVLSNQGWYSGSYEDELDSARTFWLRRNRLASIMMVDLEEMDSDCEVAIHRIEPTDESLWKFDYSLNGSSPENSQRIEALVDPKRNFDAVQLVIEDAAGKKQKHQFEFVEMQGVRVIASWKMSNVDGETIFQTTITELSNEDAKAIKQEVNEVVAKAEEAPEPIDVPITETKTIGQTLASPMALAIGWPAMGLVFLAIDFVCDRIRWKRKA